MSSESEMERPSKIQERSLSASEGIVERTNQFNGKMNEPNSDALKITKRTISFGEPVPNIQVRGEKLVKANEMKGENGTQESTLDDLQALRRVATAPSPGTGALQKHEKLQKEKSKRTGI
ncbi:hypothetical protein G7Y89_g2703 [Cudoniella acicularis]|uniref:Uncharacterized protein n=1 Tax=Cudoniella acicularis TaxID=354080 RepID=A0A8H4RUR3_9HELO|nr:hypothetical protein G7Y89_g2703 [Cudoniella acicularis]